MGQDDEIRAVDHAVLRRRAFFGQLPERNTIAWGGYLAALFEKGLLDYAHYHELIDLLPKLSAPNPIDDIFIFDPTSTESQYVRE